MCSKLLMRNFLSLFLFVIKSSAFQFSFFKLLPFKLSLLFRGAATDQVQRPLLVKEGDHQPFCHIILNEILQLISRFFLSSVPPHFKPLSFFYLLHRTWKAASLNSLQVYKQKMKNVPSRRDLYKLQWMSLYFLLQLLTIVLNL